MTVWRWIKTPASSNDTVDLATGQITWTEGQAPSTINDSARGMMAAIAKWRDDIGGTLVTTGGPTTYSIATTNQNFGGSASPPPNGTSITFTVNTPNNANATLSIDGGTSYPLMISGIAVTASVLTANTVYSATFKTGTNAWFLNNVYNFTAGIAPIGSITPYAGVGYSSANFLVANGRSLARASYTVLFNTVWGGVALFGGTAPNFNLPDLRGRVIAGIDGTGRLTTATIPNNPISGNQFGAVGGNEARTLAINDMPPHGHSVFLNDPQHSHSLNSPASVAGVGAAATTALIGTGLGNLVANTGSASTGITVRDAAGGAGNANQTAGMVGFTGQNDLALIQPTMMLSYLIRVL